MSFTITESFVQQYKSNVILLSQQKGSRLRNTVRVETDITGKTKFFERLAATAAVKRTARHGDTPLVPQEHSRRMVTLVPYEWADLVDDADKIRLLIDPASEYVTNGGYAMGRAIDDAIIEAFYSNAAAGENGTISVPLPATQKVAQDGTPSSITIAKILAAKTILDKAEVDPDEPRYMVLSATAVNTLLNTTEVKDADYNTVKALAAGQINSFCGFTFIMSNRLPLVSTGTYRAAYAWTKTGLGLAIGADIKTRISERADKSHSTQVFISMDIGATRVEDPKVIEIPCLATD